MNKHAKDTVRKEKTKTTEGEEESDGERIRQTPGILQHNSVTIVTGVDLFEANRYEYISIHTNEQRVKRVSL